MSPFMQLSSPQLSYGSEQVAMRTRFETGCTLEARWRRSQLKALRRMITENQAALCAALGQDLGKSQWEAELTETTQLVGEINEALGRLGEWMRPDLSVPSVSNFGGVCCVSPEPLGAVLIIAPWNYPLNLLLGPLVGAIAAGNVVVMKPSEYAPATADAIAGLVPKYLDQDCFSVVIGGAGESKRLLAQRWDKVFYTGGIGVGRAVMRSAAEHLTPVTLELGGKSPCIVDASADVSNAARRVVWGAFLNSGQTCVRPDYVLCHADVYDVFVTKLVQEIARQYGKDPHATPDLGRVVRSHPGHMGSLDVMVRASSRFVVHGGDIRPSENYISPTVLGYASDREAFEASPAMQREIFGPILPVFAVQSLDEAIAMVRAREFPLAAYLFTASWDSRRKFASQVEAGGVAVNDVILHVTEHDMSFGGRGMSGMGGYHGKSGFDCFTHYRSTLIKLPFTFYEFMRYPPFSPLKKFIMRLALRFPSLVKHSALGTRLAVRGGFLLAAIWWSRTQHFALIWLSAVASMVAYDVVAKVFRALTLWLLVGR